MIKSDATNIFVRKTVVQNNNIYLIQNDLGLNIELSAYNIGIPFKAIASMIDDELVPYASEKISNEDIKLFNFDNNVF